MQARIEANNEKVEVLREEMKAGHEEMKAKLEARLEKMEPNAEEMKSMAGNQDVPNEEVAVETGRAPKDRSGDRRLAVRRL
jgi:hypothetical protein